MEHMDQEGGRDLNEAMRKANETFARLRQAVERAVEEGSTQIDLVEVAEQADVGLSAKTLAHLEVNRVIYCHPWLPWHQWFPWRPLWCWWWNRYYPWYRSCPWWWHRCTPGSCC